MPAAFESREVDADSETDAWFRHVELWTNYSSSPDLRKQRSGSSSPSAVSSNRKCPLIPAGVAALLCGRTLDAFEHITRATQCEAATSPAGGKTRHRKLSAQE